ncbi:MAG: SAM-dependent methyltransferase [Bacteroidales bacterium]|nr:SAM-dependent methyltransferase [Bacteroidales bacterium]MDT8374944.1 SAM-dependent methyltransferase [Bacteroidales bacterium]
MSGVIYMVPVTLGNPDHAQTIPAGTIKVVLSLRLLAVEEIRSARRFLRTLDRAFPLDDTLFFPVGKHADPAMIPDLLRRVSAGADAGVMSEAGMPGLADPGSIVAAEAHRMNIRVIPLTGPSSIMLALVSSGLNGQRFAFHGYLPVESAVRQKALRDLERRSAGGETQIFMETPFRNGKMLQEILAVCRPSTRLCIAADITLDTEFVRTKSVAAWREALPNLDKRPTVFLLQS